MPAPAPCANTRHALDWGEHSNNPDTLTDSLTAIVTCCGAVLVTRIVCPRNSHLIHIFGK
jgi:hypothetical protein